jgi:ParB family chromosome partitioning protein
MSYYHQDSVFWIEVDKISANPYQPRREFDQEELQSLANSIRQYGVLQALVVTRKEVPKKDGGLAVEYELISGERRLRASKLAGIKEVPVLIREGGETDLMKLELAIIENLQREDLNVVERALAFEKLAKEFSFNKTQIAKKVGKSREYVSNSMRVLSLPEEILSALSAGKLTEGHARPLLMLIDRPDEQQTLFKEILYKKISVREAERIAKKIAKDRVRKPVKTNPEIEALEKEFTDSLGTRVNIESREVGGKISIDYFSDEDLHSLLEVLKMYKKKGNAPMLENFIAEAEKKEKEEVESKNISQKESSIDRSEKSTTEEVENSKVKEEVNELSYTDVPEPENDQEKPELHLAKEEVVKETEDTNKEETETSEENKSGITFEGEKAEDPLDFLVEDEEDEEKEEESTTVEEQKMPVVEEQNNENVVYKHKSSEVDEQSKEKVVQETSQKGEGVEKRDTERQEETQETKRIDNQENESAHTEENIIKEKNEEAEVVGAQKEELVQEEPEEEEPKSIQEAVKRREQEEKMMKEDFQYSEDNARKDFATSESNKDIEKESATKTEDEKLKEMLRQREAKRDKGDDDIYSVRNFTL